MLQMQRTGSVYIYIFIIGFGHIYGYAEISSDFETYIQLSTYCIQATGKTYIEFSIKALTDVHVALMTQDLSTPRDDWSQFYEIVIGVWSNQKSCIRALKEYCAYIESPGILNSAGYVQLWISWDNGDVQLGKGPKADGVVVVSHPQIIPYDVNYLAVMTHYTSSWRFYEETDCKFEEFNNTYIVTNDTRCNGVTNYACASGYNLTSGNLSRLCGTGLEWIGDPPFCSAIPLCPEILSTVSVIVLSQNIQIGGILLMTCAKHHALVAGNLFRTCLPNATGDGLEPVCEGCIYPSAGVGYQFNTTEELIKRMEEMKKKLKIEREKTNAFIRSKTSVKDSRTSSTGIGFVLGWGIIGSLPVAICLGDAASLLRHMRHGV